MTDGTLLLIDAHALIHRAYHALPPTFTNKKGEPTNAVYGFTSVFLKVLRELKPDYIAAAFDAGEKTFRHEQFEDYKANRPTTANDLSSQVPKVKEILNGFGVKIFENSTFEADDVIGTLSNKLSSDFKVIIVTGDLDSLQLVGPNVEVYTLKKGVNDTVVYDEQAVKERFGLEVSQMIDFKGLKGDPSDNIPGVKGIGEKTAIDLLQKFGTLENLYQQIEKGEIAGLKPGLVRKLSDGKEQAFFSKDLATIRLYVPLEFEVKELKYQSGQNRASLEKIFREMGFYSLWQRYNEEQFPEPGQQNSRAEKPENIIEIDAENKNQYLARLEQSSELLIVSQEKGVIFSDKPKSVFFAGNENISLLKTVFENSAVRKIGYNLKELGKFLASLGINLKGIDFDLMLASYILSPGRKDYPLDRIIFQTLGKSIIGQSIDEQIESFWQAKALIQERLNEYDLQKVFNQIEMPLLPVLAEMEKNGIRIQVKILEKLSSQASKKLGVLEEKIFKLAGQKFNINSPSQLKTILFDKLQLKVKGLRKTAGGAISTQASELNKLKGQHEIIDLILDYRELAKLKTTYLDPLPGLVDPKTSRLHTTFNQAGAATGRLSSSDPNLQNIPIQSELASEIRSAFEAEPGFVLLSFDYSQIELRIAAAIAMDEKMMSAFKEDKDIHTLTAAEVNNVPIEKVTPEMRRSAKALNFGVLYGMGARSFAESSGISREKAEQFIKEYFSDFSGLAKYIEEIKDEARRNGFVRTLTGRRRYLPEIHGPNDMIVAQAERMAVNMPIQGTCADIMKLAMIKVHDYLSKNGAHDFARMILTVHDELLLEVEAQKIAEIAPAVKQIMENVLKLPVPIKVDVKSGENWGTMSRLNI